MMLCLSACAVEPSRNGLPLTVTRPVASCSRPASAVDHLDGARADLAGDAHDLAARHAHAEAFDAARHRQVLHGQGGASRRPRRLRVHLDEAAAEHHLDQALRSISATRRVATSSPLRMHADAVADAEHFGQPMGDVDDRSALPLERQQRREDAVDLEIRQGRGRLVEDEHAGFARQHAGDLDQLPLADGEPSDRLCRAPMWRRRAGRAPRARGAGDRPACGRTAP